MKTMILALTLAASTLNAGTEPQAESRHTAVTPAPKWYVAHVANINASDPFTTSRIYGPWRGQKGIMRAIEACGKLVDAKMRTEGWRCGAGPVMPMPKSAGKKGAK